MWVAICIFVRLFILGYVTDFIMVFTIIQVFFPGGLYLYICSRTKLVIFDYHSYPWCPFTNLSIDAYNETTHAVVQYGLYLKAGSIRKVKYNATICVGLQMAGRLQHPCRGVTTNPI